jgi:hypothetical protein
MISQNVIAAVHSKLFASTELTAIVGTNIAYARGPISNTWPQVHYFEVAGIEGYQVDFNSCTIQFSAWSLDKFQALAMKEVLYGIFSRFKGLTSVTGGTVDITWTELVDSGALPDTDPQLFGQYLRFLFRYRGANIGGY